MKSLLALTLTLVGVVLSAMSEKDVILSKFMDSPKELFKVYHLLFKKENKYKLDSEEGIRRYKIFKANIKWNKEKNAELGKKIYGITEFTDMTHEEFVDKMLMKPAELEKITGRTWNFENNQSTKESSFLKYESAGVDWRSKLNPVKHQGGCGSCWAFASIGAIEGSYNIKYNQLLDLSEQYLVDCDYNASGCQGGWPSETFKWLKDGGVLTQKQSPYKGRQVLCDSYFRNQAMDIIESFDFCDYNKCDKATWSSLLRQGPLVVTLDSSAPGFGNYSPENEEPWDPPQKCGAPNHAVLAVGSVYENGREVLIVRNSWGADWGIKGYFKLYADNHCGIMDSGLLAKVKQTAPLPPQKCPNFFSKCYLQGNKFSTCTGVSNFQDKIGGPMMSFDPNETELDYYYVYREPNCKGEQGYIYSTEKCYEQHWTAPILSGFHTSRGPSSCGLSLFEEACKGGRQINIFNSIGDLSQTPIKIIKSVGVNYYSQVQAYVFFENKNYDGWGYGLQGKETYNFEEDPEAVSALNNAQSLGMIIKFG